MFVSNVDPAEQVLSVYRVSSLHPPTPTNYDFTQFQTRLPPLISQSSCDPPMFLLIGKNPTPYTVPAPTPFFNSYPTTKAIIVEICYGKRSTRAPRQGSWNKKKKNSTPFARWTKRIFWAEIKMAAGKRENDLEKAAKVSPSLCSAFELRRGVIWLAKVAAPLFDFGREIIELLISGKVFQ